MSRTIPNTPLCAATSCTRIEFVASPRAGAAWLIWLATSVVLVWCSHFSWPLEFLLAAHIMITGGWSVRRIVWLKGPRAVRALEWPDEEGVYHVFLGASGSRLAAIPDGCRRYGDVWLLRFQTAGGGVQLLVDARYQEAQAVRRLGRRLFQESDHDGARSGGWTAVN